MKKFVVEVYSNGWQADSYAETEREAMKKCDSLYDVGHRNVRYRSVK